MELPANRADRPHVVVVGGGFTGLSAAYQLSKQGIGVTVIEKKETLGGLADSFELDGLRLGKFYYTWFTNDIDIIQLIKEIGCGDELLSSPVKTSLYRDHGFYSLSKPADILRFSPLRFTDRLRFGFSFLRARKIKDWKKLESLTAKEWLTVICGAEAYRIVWEPLLKGKFGEFADRISAAWMWGKLVLSGKIRSGAGRENHLYYNNSLGALAEKIAEKIISSGNIVRTSLAVESLVVEDGAVRAVKTADGVIQADAVILTPALPIIADIIGPHVPEEYAAGLLEIKYLANICLVLDLTKGLSDIYWLNVNEPDFPFVGVIQYSNLYSPDNWRNRNIVYITKYLSATDRLYQMGAEELLGCFTPYIKRMFPGFEPSQVKKCFLWKALYAQPITVKNHGKLIPSHQTPVKDLYIATMAQIYPEDRGTNYSVKQGRYVAKMVAGGLMDEK